MRLDDTGIAPVTFIGSAVIALGLIVYASIWPQSAAAIFSGANAWIIAEAGWFYMLSVGIFVIFLLGLAMSSLGKVKLGPDDSVPDYKYGTWVAMLFSAGMGIGIVFYGVAEPIMHFAQPPDAVPRSAQAARDAMGITFFHWGVHAWAIYAVLGLSLAYFGYRRNQPLAIRSAFHPIVGDRIHGPLGDCIDIFAVVGTLAGLATSLGLGVSQLNASMNYLFDMPQNVLTQLVLIAVVTALATITVATGLDNGIRRLSELIIIVSGILMLLIVILGPTRFLLGALVENIGIYIHTFVARTFHVYAYEPTKWVGDWTIFYWGWWISWSPFVGMFIARISRGRTIRQFLLGVLFAPAGFSFIWFTIFGDLAIWLDVHVANGQIAQTVAGNMPIALFTVFDFMPWSRLLAWITGLLVAVYFVTASDAGALVVSMITSKGDEEPPLWLRVFWALACGAIAGCLLLAGGLEALQAAAVIAAFPFCILMLIMCYGILKGLRDEITIQESRTLPTAPLMTSQGGLSLRQRLNHIVSHPTKTRANNYIAKEVIAAFDLVASELQKRGIAAEVVRLDDGAQLIVHHGDEAEDFTYAVRMISQPIPAFALSDAARGEGEKKRFYRAEVFLNKGGRGYDIYGYNSDQVAADVINHYDRFRHYLYVLDPDTTM
ncbi:BCCT family transporter [Candidimonas sp. SYP-B2681]|uniref:BCCT family transporter n=1 Tax=Candidimonas sp. SYP-B2681 TaxID=2497686 RepID=UPI0018F44D91|nr:BCCT family transporter [Candidimonas sp. SYP-B2681]